MSKSSFKFEKANRSLMERLFEPPAVGRMSPAAKVVAYSLLVFWSLFVIFPIYWVVITAFKDAAAVNQGPFYIPFVDFQPTLAAWRVHLSGSQLRSLFHRPAVRAARPQLLRLHRVAHGEASADGATDLQDLSRLHQFAGDRRRLHGAVRGDRQHGGLCAGPRPVQAQVRQCLRVFVLLTLA